MKQLDYLLNSHRQLDRLLLQKEGEHKAILSTKVELEKQVSLKKQEAELLEKVVAVVQKLTEISRKETLEKVAAIVTTALQEVKDPNLSFRINYKTERSQAVAEFVVYNSKLKAEMDPIESCGGTLVDIIEFALKISLLLKWQPQLSRVLILDEALKHVSAVDKPAMAQFVRKVTEKLGIQLILVSHSSELISDAHKVFSVSHDGVQSHITVENSEIHSS